VSVWISFKSIQKRKDDRKQRCKKNGQ